MCVCVCVCLYEVRSLFAFVGRLCGFVGVCMHVGKREREDAVMCQYDSSVFVLFFPLTSHQARDLAPVASKR